VVGPQGAQGPAGPAGAQGAPGPGGKILTYDATASATPTRTTIGTVLGDTLSASCSIPAAGEAQLNVYLQTVTGGWDADYTVVADTNGTVGTSGTVTTDASSYDAPPGAYSAPVQVATVEADSGGHQSDTRYDFIQTVPFSGSMSWHEDASTANNHPQVQGLQTCHLSVEAIPETMTSVLGP
jgi:hypothetical protein